MQPRIEEDTAAADAFFLIDAMRLPPLKHSLSFLGLTNLAA